MDLSEFDIDFLSQKLSDNPRSPLFARLADLYLSKHQSAEALKLCEAGVQTYGSYATGFVILGKCYSAMNQKSKARLAYAQALYLAPFNQVARKLLDEIPVSSKEPPQAAEIEPIPITPPVLETKSIPAPPAAATVVQEESPFVQPVEEPQPVDENVPSPPAPEATTMDIPLLEENNIVETPPVETSQLPGLDDYIQQQSINAGGEKFESLDEYLDQDDTPATPEPTGLDSLAAQLENAGHIVPQEPEPSESPEESAPLDSIVITPTLAEIYASQGEYGAAIQAYEILIYSKPDERERFEKRIGELQAKLNEGG